eukprot:1248190-Ditylum_brightwellii.AAC.1
MAKCRLKDGKGDLAAVIQNIKHCEEMKQAFQQMKLITKGITGGVDSKLLFQHAQPFKVLDDQDEVMLTLVRRNKLHLHQAYDNPFAKKDMQDYIEEFGTERVAQEILDG